MVGRDDAMLNAPITDALSRYLDLQTSRMQLTAANMANQNTAGYARRSVTWTSRDTVSLSGAVNAQAGAVTVAAQRDPTLDRSVATAMSASAAASTLQSALNTLQGVFAIGSSGDEGSDINAALSGFFAAVQALAAQPTSSSARHAALAAAQTVTGAFQQTGAQLAAQREQLNGMVVEAAVSLNAKTAQIAMLNGSITLASSAADLDRLIDQRTALVEDVSKLVGVQQTVNSDGSVDLYASNGAPLVVGTREYALNTTTVSGAVHVMSEGHDVTLGLTGGSIGGALAARDGAVASVQAGLDALATSFATAVNTANAAGYTVSGAAGGAIFSLPAGGSAASGIAVVAASGNDFAAAGQSEGDAGSGNANAMTSLQTQKVANGMTFADALSAVVSGVGTASSSAVTSARAAGAALTQTSAARDAFSGVSLDTEAANLTQYQRSYQAEAKLLAVLDAVLASAINIGTETAVS